MRLAVNQWQGGARCGQCVWHPEKADSPGVCVRLLCPPEGGTEPSQVGGYIGPARPRASRLLGGQVHRRDLCKPCGVPRHDHISPDGLFGKVGKVSVLGMGTFPCQRSLFQGWKRPRTSKQVWCCPAPRLLGFRDGPPGKEPELRRLCTPITQLPGLGPGPGSRARS